ncbi:hypothetical protein ABZ920_01590 [Streptomyces sp. NPDC046831]|uniref:hypothetical protein n=1 Tax=Streptomyces sp. NPDC046831 TaxID=3154805 RepID=UPI00340964F2
MRLSTHYPVQRIWTVQLHPQADGPALVCSHCPLHTPRLSPASARSAALTHLAQHAQREVIPKHLRTCQCRTRGCCWHPRHRGCSGPIRLALSCGSGGRLWRLADICSACAAASRHTAVVPDTLLNSQRSGSVGAPTRKRRKPACGAGDRLLVQEMLTYLAAALPRFSSASARLLALQCALRADTRGNVRLPHGLLRGMHVHGRAELWSELAYAGWLQCAAPREPHREVHLLDAAMHAHATGRRLRARAAHWAMHPTPLILPQATPSALRLTALALAAHTSGTASSADADLLARLSGQAPEQLEDALDELVRFRLLQAWQHPIGQEEIFWWLPR